MTEHLALEEIRPSIGSVGDAYGNALMETINGLYKAGSISSKRRLITRAAKSGRGIVRADASALGCA